MKRTNVVLDEKKIKEAKKILEVSTIREVIDLALTELIRTRSRKNILKLKGQIDIDLNLDQSRRTG